MVEKYFEVSHNETMKVYKLQELFNIVLKRFDHSVDAQECVVNFLLIIGEKYHRKNECITFFTFLFTFEVDNLLPGKYSNVVVTMIKTLVFSLIICDVILGKGNFAQKVMIASKWQLKDWVSEGLYLRFGREFSLS